MKLIIDIPEEAYKKLLEEQHLPKDLDVEYLIMNGTPLPKGHGDLIDKDEFLLNLGNEHIGGIEAIKEYTGENTWTDGLHTAWRVIDDMSAIIEADKENKE